MHLSARGVAMKLCLRTSAVVLAVAFSACSSTRYSYAPVTTTTAELSGASAAVYGMPPDAPRGEVRIAMLGLTAMSALGAQDTASSDAIHLGLAVSNRSDQAWTVDPSEQHLALTLKNQRSDIYATSGETPRSSTVVVPPRSTRMIDLYFSLPVQLKTEDAPPPFDVVWTVHAGARPVTQRTTFQRFIVAPTPEQDRDVRKPEELPESDRGLPATELPERTPVLPVDPLDPINHWFD